MSGRHARPLRTGAGSFKRMLDSAGRGLALIRIPPRPLRLERSGIGENAEQVQAPKAPEVEASGVGEWRQA